MHQSSSELSKQKPEKGPDFPKPCITSLFLSLLLSAHVTLDYSQFSKTYPALFILSLLMLFLQVRMPFPVLPPFLQNDPERLIPIALSNISLLMQKHEHFFAAIIVCIQLHCCIYVRRIFTFVFPLLDFELSEFRDCSMFIIIFCTFHSSCLYWGEKGWEMFYGTDYKFLTGQVRVGTHTSGLLV